MAGIIFKAKMTALDKTFKTVTDAITDMINDDDNMKQRTSLVLARNLKNTMTEKYLENQRKISGLVHGSANVITTIRDTKKGYVVSMTGEDVLYQEYGTGTRGLENPHPNHDVDGMKPYGSGRNIISGTEEICVTFYDAELGRKRIKWMYFNKNNGKRTPYWYPLYLDKPGRFLNDFNGNQIEPGDYVWRHGGVITKGLSAGKFVYESCRKYQKDSRFGEKDTLKRTIKQNIQKELERKIEEKIALTKDMGSEDIMKAFVKLKIAKRGR